jgi:Rieske Fe-S protein
MDEHHLTRRRFLLKGATTVTASACLGCAIFRQTRTPDMTVSPRNGKIELSRAEVERKLDLLENTDIINSLIVKPEGTDEKILLFRTADGELHALSSICTHMGCDVHYDLDVGHIVCPCHGSEYALDGSNLKGPAKRPLKEYEVREDADKIIIEM